MNATGARESGGGVAVALVLLGVVLPGPISAQQSPPPASQTAQRGFVADPDAAPRPVARAARASGAIQVDGVLDEATWAAAPVIDQFTQQRPDLGAPATERTEVRILYDDDFLYVGAELYQSVPGSLVIPTLQRDPNTRDGDAFGIAFDTFRDGTSAYAFFINPGGAVRDVQTRDLGRINNAAWDAAFDLETRIHDRGWTVELAIPWSQLRFNPSEDEAVWGLNLLRRIRSKNEDATWAPMDRQYQLYVTSRAGTLEGLSQLRPGRNLTVKPWVLASDPSGVELAGASTDFDAGVDLKYGITPSMTLDVTLNTDFSQVEVDQQQVNLTRFSLFFPEKREFFLENAGIFQFGDQGQRTQRTGVSNRDFTLFHSRRIGLTPSGTPLPILAGGRVTGTAGGVSLGLINMQTRAEDAFAAENFTVARVRGELGGSGLTLGGIFVNRTETGGGTAANRSYGVDATLEAVNNYLLIQGYLAGTGGMGADGTALEDEFAGRLSVRWADPFWEAMAMVRQFDDDFDPGAGFVRRRGMTHGFATLGVHPRVSWPGVQELNPYVEAHLFDDLSGALESREVTLGLSADLTDGSMAQFTASDRFERVDDAFTVGGAQVEAGRYDYTEYEASYTASRARPLSGRFSIGGGDYFGGTRFSTGANVFGRLSHRWLLEAGVQHNRIELPGQQSTTADVYSAKLDAFASTELMASAFVQFDETRDQLVTNIRFRWIHGPLSDLFLVLTERRDTAAREVRDRFVTLKFTKLVSF